MYTKYLELEMGFQVEAKDSMELKELLGFILEDEKVELLGIGNNNVLIDCVGPSVLTMINDTWNTKYQSLCSEKAFNEWKKEYRANKVLAIDSSLSADRNDLGKIYISNKGIKPGEGIGRNIEAVGDISIKLVTGVYTPEFEGLKFKEKNELIFYGEDSEYIKFIDDEDIFDMIVAITAAIEDFIIK